MLSSFLDSQLSTELRKCLGITCRLATTGSDNDLYCVESVVNRLFLISACALYPPLTCAAYCPGKLYLITAVTSFPFVYIVRAGFYFSYPFNRTTTTVVSFSN